MPKTRTVEFRLNPAIPARVVHHEDNLVVVETESALDPCELLSEEFAEWTLKVMSGPQFDAFAEEVGNLALRRALFQ